MCADLPGGGGGDAAPQGSCLDRKLFPVLGMSPTTQDSSAAFKLEGEALTCDKLQFAYSSLRRCFAILVLGSAFREILYNSILRHRTSTRPEGKLDISSGAKEEGCWTDRLIRLHNIAQRFGAARNIELLHESGNSNKRDRDGNRIQNRGQGQQENKGRYDQGQHEYRGRQDQSVEHRGRQDRGYDSKRQDFGSDQRFAGRMGTIARVRVRGGLLRLCLLHLFVLPVESSSGCGQDFRYYYRYFSTLMIVCLVLFDTGATHSIISTTFAKKLNMTPTPLIERVIISTPMKNHMLIDHEYVNCPLRFDDRIRPANLLPIHMLDFDVILGMDWLASHRATIDCYARTVIFGTYLISHGAREIEFGIEFYSPCCTHAQSSVSMAPVEMKESKEAVTGDVVEMAY
ncbi:reverse transcriptase domain-containing protein [Tanacetum coccineum]